MSIPIITQSDRAAACWRIENCESCLKSTASCGWCPNSYTCVPASSIFTPIKYGICPLRSERFELRTSTFGCDCSTITLLSIIITILCTLAATLLWYGIWKLQIIQWMWRIFGPGVGEGWERVEEDGIVKEGPWRRGGRRWKFKLFTGLADDDDTLGEGTRLLRS